MESSAVDGNVGRSTPTYSILLRSPLFVVPMIHLLNNGR